MRIVFDIDEDSVTFTGGSCYCNMPGFQGYNGVNVDMQIVPEPNSGHPTINLVGSAENVRRILETALSAINLTEAHFGEKFGEERSTNCPDGCEGIEANNGLHATTCPKHPNYAILNAPNNPLTASEGSLPYRVRERSQFPRDNP